MSSFGQRLQQCMGDTMSQADLARAIGIKQSSVFAWCHDHVQTANVKAEPLLRVASFLGVNPLWLLTGRGLRDQSFDTLLSVAEPTPTYGGWPFPSISPDSFARLDNDVRQQVEAFVQGVIVGNSGGARSTKSGTEG